MLETLLASAARMALPRLREALRAGPHDLAEDTAVSKAAGAVAVQLLRRGEGTITAERVEHLSTVLVETLGRSDQLRLQRVESVSSFRSSLIGSFREALQPLDEVGVGFRELGIEATADEVAVLFVDALTESLHVWGARSDRLRSVATVLHVEKVRELLPSVTDGAPPPPVVRAWITVESTPPELYVYNDGPSPIFEVVPTPALIALDLHGEMQAMVGAGAMTGNVAAQISPEHGYRWPLEHMRSWGGSPLVLSQLHVDFKDNAGRRWRLAHDQLTALT